MSDVKPSSEKTYPERQCMACREHKPKRELLKVTRSPEGDVYLDQSGKGAGRGAYICPRPACLKRVIKSKALERSLKCKLDETVYRALDKAIDTIAREAESGKG